MNMKYNRQPLTIGQVYRFTFVDELTKVNNIYRLLGIHTYEHVDAMAYDPFEVIYAMAGMTAKYISDKKMFSFRGDVIYEVKSTVDDQVLFIPESILVNVPVGGYREYDKLMFTCQLGVIPDQIDMETTIVAIQQLLQHRLGISPRILTSSYGKQYLNEEAVSALEQARDVLKTKSTPPEMVAATYKAQRDEYAKKAVHYEQWIAKHLGGIPTTQIP